MDISLDNQVAVVTGAGRGIGRAIALALVGHGAAVVAAARTESELKSLADETAGKAVPVPTDVSDESSIVALFERVGERFGRLDILVNNAGMGIFGPVESFATEDFDKVLAVNLRGSFLCSREALRMMIPRHSGYIINISSVVGFKGYVNQAAYTAGKHGVMGLTKTLAVENHARGVRTSVILPGGVDTGLIADGRPDLDRSILIRPEDIAQTVLYLLSLSDRAHVDQIYIRRRTGEAF